MKNEQVTTKQHPVPQNIMEVEFKLIGDMTIRQFSYVAVGGFLCYLIFSGGLPALIRWPLLFLISFLSLGLAFLPVEEQGLDEWIRNFFVATFSPTQRVWGGRKAGRAPKAKKPPVTRADGKRSEEAKELPSEAGKRLKESVAKVGDKGLSEKQVNRRVRDIGADLEKIVATLERSEGGRVSGAVREENLILKKRLRGLSAELDKLREGQGFDQVAPDLKRTSGFYQERVKTLEEKIRVLEESGERKEHVEDTPKVASGAKEEYQKQVAVLAGENKGLAEKVSVAEGEAAKLRKELETLKHEDAVSAQRVSDRDSELKRLEDERNKAVAGLDRLQRRVSGLERPGQPVPAHQAPPSVGEEKREKEKPAVVREKIAPIIDAFPNVVSGVVKGQQGELLAGMMVVISDVDGDLVRALKTNKLGQFVIATPLPNGDYTVRVKNAQGAYTPVRVQMDGSVLEPIVFRVGGIGK